MRQETFSAAPNGSAAGMSWSSCSKPVIILCYDALQMIKFEVKEQKNREKLLAME